MAVDPTFGSGGATQTPIEWNSTVPPVAACQADGKIVIAAGRTVSGGGAAMVLIRLNPDGSLDNSFGTGGVAAFPGQWTDAVASAIFVQQDGRILVGTQAIMSSNTGGLYRFNSDGSLDTTFGTAGQLSVDFPLQGIGEQPGGAIVAAGAHDKSIVVARFNLDGSRDDTFAGGGRAEISLASADYFKLDKLLIAPDGRIVLGAQYDVAPGSPQTATIVVHLLVTRLNADGSADTSFNQGLPVTRAYDSRVTDMSLMPDGGVLLLSQNASGAVPIVILSRFNADGSADAAFGTDGVVVSNSGQPLETDWGPSNLYVRPTGEIVVQGSGTGYLFSTHFDSHGNFLHADETKFTVDSDSFVNSIADANGKLIGLDWDPRIEQDANGHSSYHYWLRVFRINPDGYAWAPDPAPVAAAALSPVAQIIQDRAAVRSARNARKARLAALEANLQCDRVAYRAAIRQAHAASHLSRLSVATGNTQSVTQLAARLSEDRNAIVSFRRSDLTGVFAAEQTLRVDVKQFHHSR